MGFPLQNNGLVGAQHLLRALGLNLEQMLDSIEDLQDQMSDLGELGDSFNRCCGGMSPHALGQLISGGAIANQGAMPRPDAGCCPCASKFAPGQSFDLGSSAPGSNFFQRLGNRLQGATTERFLHQNPFARAQVEMMLGGRIVPDGINDGRIQVQPFAPGCQSVGGQQSQAAAAALGLLDAVTRAAQALSGIPGCAGGGHGGLPGMGQGGPFNGMMQQMMLGALASLLGVSPQALANQLQSGGTNAPANGGGTNAAANNAGNNRSVYANGGKDGAGGSIFGAGDKKRPDGTYPGEEGSPENVSAILADPSLTIEDKITLMLMAIMKKMDKDIEKQGEKINKLQQKQGGKGGGKGSPSIDVETMKLKRMIDKRSQMFDMLRQIIDKYNETAKNIIQSIGR